MKIKILLVVSLMVVLAGACVTVRSGPKTKKISRFEGFAGRTIPEAGLSIDASYDPRLDDLIYGYKLLPVTIRNVSLRAIPMDVRKDLWVVVGEKGQRYRAINSLKLKDPILWREVPDRMRSMIDYPEALPINYNVTFDLLLPKKAQLEYFRQIRYRSAVMGQEFVIDKEY